MNVGELKTIPDPRAAVVRALGPSCGLALLHVDDGQKAKELQVSQPHQDPQTDVLLRRREDEELEKKKNFRTNS